MPLTRKNNRSSPLLAAFLPEKRRAGFTPLEILKGMFYTYVLQSKKDGKWYTGSTKDLRKRLVEHNAGRIFSTKNRGPFEVIYYEACRNESDTRDREKYLKTGMGKRYLKNRLKRFLSLTGFTLIEMLLVITVVSVISLTIYATFNNGMKLWQKANRQLPEEDLNIFFDKFTSDLRNSFKFTGINFAGTQSKLEFPTLVNSQALKARSVGRVRYIFEPDSGVLSREQEDYSQVYTKEGKPLGVLNNIKSLKFQYYVYDKEKKEYLWLEEWTKAGLPLAVRIELEMGYDSKDNKFIKTVSIPCGG